MDKIYLICSQEEYESLYTHNFHTTQKSAENWINNQPDPNEYFIEVILKGETLPKKLLVYQVIADEKVIFEDTKKKADLFYNNFCQNRIDNIRNFEQRLIDAGYIYPDGRFCYNGFDQIYSHFKGCEILPYLKNGKLFFGRTNPHHLDQETGFQSSTFNWEVILPILFEYLVFLKNTDKCKIKTKIII